MRKEKMEVSHNGLKEILGVTTQKDLWRPRGIMACGRCPLPGGLPAWFLLFSDLPVCTLAVTQDPSAAVSGASHGPLQGPGGAGRVGAAGHAFF